MKAIKILKKYQDEIQTSIPSDIDLSEVIKEAEELEASANENKTLVNILIKVYEEMIKLREENQELKNNTTKRINRWKN